MVKKLRPQPKRYTLQKLATLFFVLLLPAVTIATAQDNTEREQVVEDIMQATVFIMQTYEIGTTQAISCVGSGTLVSQDGLILTNAHLATAMGPCRGERIVIALPLQLDEPPIPTYTAELQQVDPAYNLAVLQISAGLDGSPIDRASLNLPHVRLGDPSSLLPGNGVLFSGYEDLTATGVSLVEGVITGITAETNGSEFAWLRTDASLGGGMSGGGVYTNDGRLVGIMSSAPRNLGTQADTTCLSIQDSDQDGIITERDPCVPIGTPITAFRPVVFAHHLLNAATNGLSSADSSPPGPGLSPNIDPLVGRLFVSSGVNPYQYPSRIISSAPSGTDSLFLFFEHKNMPPGMPYLLQITRDGQPMPQFSLGPLVWSGPQDGIWYIGTEGKTWPDGLYEFTLLINDLPVGSVQLRIGADPTENNILSDLVFGIPDAQGNLSARSPVFPATITQLAAEFSYSQMIEGTAWSEIWYLNNEVIYKITHTWDAGRDGHHRLSVSSEAGLPEGNYQLEILIEDRLAAIGLFTLAGQPTSDTMPIALFNGRVSNEISNDGKPANAIGTSGMAFPFSSRSLYVFFDWDNISTGTNWTYRWFHNGRLAISETQPWGRNATGNDMWIGLFSDQQLSEGEYTLDILIENQPFISVAMTVGSGTQAETGTDADSNEVLITGKVVDALTGDSIDGALVFFLDVAFESPAFLWDSSQIHTQAVTDRNGQFELLRGLERGRYYTIYVIADGYITMVDDNVTIFRDQPSPTDILIQMTRP